VKTITVLSGKGGVGKSSISASLALVFSKDRKIICADCDVDASNLPLVFGAEKQEEWNNLSTNKKVIFDLDKCNSCKKCFNNCYFKAIGWDENKPYLKNFSCEGCGLCELVCPMEAISLKNEDNAKIGYTNTRYGFKVVFAQLNIGSSGSGKVVFEVRKKAKELSEDADIMLIDSAAGIGCPVIASVTGSDYAVIVTEPTPSGFSDMKKALEVVRHFRIPCGIIINKYDLNQSYTLKIKQYAEENSLKVISKIAFDKKFVIALTKMIPIIQYENKYLQVFEDMKVQLNEEIGR